MVKSLWLHATKLSNKVRKHKQTKKFTKTFKKFYYPPGLMLKNSNSYSSATIQITSYIDSVQMNAHSKEAAQDDEKELQRKIISGVNIYTIMSYYFN